MPPELDLFALPRGSVTAPAGCGKTQLVADTLQAYAGAKPVLVLTHTNAGVAALRARLVRARVPTAAYRLSTLDGFAMRLVSNFPMRSAIAPQVLELNTPKQDYPTIRSAAVQLVRDGHVNDTLRATYAALLVDEYQDCNVHQHALVAWMANTLRTCVLGDPLQAIFGLGNNQLVDWTSDVQPQFPAIGELRTPWRWRIAGTEDLGQWLLSTRAQLQAGGGVHLGGAPPHVQWVQIDPRTAVQQRLVAARGHAPDRGTVLVIGDARRPQGRHQITSQIPGATAVEAVDLGDLVSFARSFDPMSAQALPMLIEFTAGTVTGVGAANLLQRVPTLRAGRARTPPTLLESAAVQFTNVPSLPAAASFMEMATLQAGAHVYRPEMLRCCLAALRNACSGAHTFHAAAVLERERNRHAARYVSRRAVGSTLLLKGLEADMVVILQPELMTASNLYVALTRGAKKVIVCSETALLRPALA
jgi:DNA helicase-2/ATP-dependent DNA helicase PcrA